MYSPAAQAGDRLTSINITAGMQFSGFRATANPVFGSKILPSSQLSTTRPETHVWPTFVARLGNNETETKRSINSPSCHRGPDPCNSQLGCFSVCSSSKHERRTAQAAIPWMDIFTFCLCALLHLHCLRLVVCFSLPGNLGDPRRRIALFGMALGSFFGMLMISAIRLSWHI